MPDLTLKRRKLMLAFALLPVGAVLRSGWSQDGALAFLVGLCIKRGAKRQIGVEE